MSSGDLSTKQKLLLRYAGIKSHNEIAELTGIKPEDVARETAALLDSIDELTVQHKRMKLLIGLEEVNEELRSRLADMSDRNVTAAVATFGANNSRILKELRDTEKADAGKIEQLNQLRIRELLRLIDMTVAKSVEEAEELNGLEAGTLMPIFQKNLIVAAKEIEGGS